MKTMYIDESKARGYTVVTVVVASGDTIQIRKSVDALRMSGQRRLHFVKEGDSRRRAILSEFVRMGVRATIYHVTGMKDEDARRLCLAAVVADAVALGVDRIILERDDSIEQWDRRVLFEELKALGMSEKITYGHETSAVELLLCLPDAIAWSHVRGGEWTARIQPMIIEIKKLG